MEHFMGLCSDPCPCGSGLKWKKCTCKEYHPDASGAGLRL